MRKHIYLIISLLLILVGAGVFCAINWEKWFHNVPEPDYVVAQKPNNIVLTFGEKAQSERIISWRADTLFQPSYLRLNHIGHIDTLSVDADSTLIITNGGKAAYYKARVSNLHKGVYQYQCVSADKTSDWHQFTVTDSDTTTVLLFGDIQDKKGSALRQMMSQAVGHCEQLDAICYTGNILEYPLDKYWQLWQRSLEGLQQRVPQMAVAGSREYLKGVPQKLDERWLCLFGKPNNAPERFLRSTTYFVDFPQARFIMLDTNPLYLLVDYTVMQTWLSSLLKTADSRWKIVIMHHPVHYASKGRYTPLIFSAFHETLKEADIVFCGHDRQYVRRDEIPQYIVINSSEQFLEPRNDIEQNEYVVNFQPQTKVYSKLTITSDSLSLQTYNVITDKIIDTLSLSR